MAGIIKSRDEVNKIRQAGKVAAHLLSVLRVNAAPGTTTSDLDTLAAEYLKRHEAISSLRGYYGFPAYISISLNDEILNGIPSKYSLRTGDVLKFDVGVTLNGWHAISAITVPVGQIDAKTTRLLQTTEHALSQGIAAARAGNRVRDIGRAIQQPVEAVGFSVVREFGGCGTGRYHHEDPLIFGYVNETYPNFVVKPGMVLYIVAIVNAGAASIEEGGWGIFTADRSVSATFGHTIAITGEEPDILTR